MISKLLFITCFTILLFQLVGVLTREVQAVGLDKLRIDGLELDKTKVIRPCSPGVKPISDTCNDSRVIRVKATVSGGEKNARIDVIVSGGRANRIGPLEFDWDLSGAVAGTYTITASAIQKNNRVTTSKTAIATVVDCDSCVHADVCPVITLNGPAGVMKAGDNVTFTATVGESENVTYNWTVSAGTIISGNGTPSIVVSTDNSMSGSTLTATVYVSSPNWMMACITTASDSVSFENVPTPRLVDEFRTGGKNCEEGFARMDSFYIELNNNPNDRGVVIIYTDSSQSGSGRWRRLTLNNHIKMRRFDAARITFIDGPMMKDGTTQFWIVPPGADMPELQSGDGPIIPTTGEKSEPTGPYLYATEFSDGIPGCSGNLFDLAEYAEVLNADPKNKGRVVISENSAANYRKKRREILAELAAIGIGVGRVAFIYKYVRPMRLLESTELWIIPAVKSKK